MSADQHGKWPVFQLAAEGRAPASHRRYRARGRPIMGCPDGFDTPEEAQRHDANKLNALLATVAIPIFYVMGNDDLVELNSNSDRVQSVHARQVRWGRFTIVGYQYSLPFMGGTFEKPDAAIEVDLAPLAGFVGADTIFVSHSPAFGILDPGFGESQIGSRSLRQFLDTKPFLAHIHGHSHAGFGRSGKHFNVASAGRQRAMVLDTETMKHDVLDLEPRRSEA